MAAKEVSLPIHCSGRIIRCCISPFQGGGLERVGSFT
jgi:hypothetical protein